MLIVLDISVSVHCSQLCVCGMILLFPSTKWLSFLLPLQFFIDDLVLEGSSQWSAS